MESCTTTYFEHRLAELRIPPEDAAQHGLREDEHGNIEQIIRTFDGQPILWLDKRGRNARKIAAIRNRRTFTENGGGIEKYLRELTITRYSPENLERIRQRKPDAGKYRYSSKAITGHGVYPMPTVEAIKAFTRGKTGGVAIGVEGYFKAAAMAVHGAEATAFTGITTYKVDGAMAEYLERRRPDDFIIMYDADARQLSTKQKNTEVVDTQRVVDFFHSAATFARQFHNFCKRTGIKSRLHFCAVSEGTGHKGVDDLLAAHTPEESRRIMADLHTLRSSKYFDFIRLGSSNFERRLVEFFGVANHSAFYRRHAAFIGERPFRFSGATYQLNIPARHFDLMEYKNGHQYFRMMENPFHVEMEAEAITVNRFMAEATEQLDGVLAAMARVCVEAPTGTGKTSFFLGYRRGRRRFRGWFERAGERGVITVPTVMLAKQLAKKNGIPAVCGSVSNKMKERALNAPVVVCTYDTLHHITDLETRVLVVDECHNLVNQYGEIKKNRPFRADTLRRVVARFDVAKKVVIISGTPPRMMARHYGFHYVEVQRRENNLVNVYTMAAENSGHKALTAAVVAELQRVNWDDGRVHFVYYNHGAQLEFIREHMLCTGLLKAEDITIITREHVDGGHRIFNEIVAAEKITGAKLILTTCLMAEGINIANCDIGNIYTVAINCVDSFRQFVARFRNMEELHVYDIRPPERPLDKWFMFPATVDLENLRKMAATQLEVVENIARHFSTEWPDDILAFYDDVKPQYVYQSEHHPYVYQTDDGGHAVDELRMFAAIRERMMETGNNCFFYSQLSQYPNIRIQGTEPMADDGHAEATEAMEEIAESLHRIKEHKLATLREKLDMTPSVVVSAYHLHAGKSNNRHATARIETMAGELISPTAEATAREYLREHADDFRQKWFKNAISRFLRLHFAGVDEPTMERQMAAGEREFYRRWRRWKTWMEFSVYDNRRHRLALTDLHKADIKFKKRAAEFIMEHVDDDGAIRSDKLTQLLNAKSKRVKLSAAMDGVEEQPVVVFDEPAAERLVYSLFEVVCERRFHGFKVYTLRAVEEPPFHGTCTPVEFLKMYS